MSQQTQVDYAELFDALAQPYITFAADAPDFTIIAENKAHAAVAMVQPEDVIGKPVLEAFPDTSDQYKKTGVSELVESLKRVVETGKPDSMDAFRYDLKDHEGRLQERYFRVTHYPVLGAKGQVELLYQLTADITEEMSAGRKLEDTQRQLDEALASGYIGTYMWDVSHDYVMADKNLLNLFGIDLKKAENGLPLVDFTNAIYVEDRAPTQAAIEHTLKTKSPFEMEYRTVNNKGELQWVLARGRVEDADNTTYFQGVVVDITERKVAEQRLRFLADASNILSSSLDYEKTLRSVAQLVVPETADWCGVDLLINGKIEQVAVAHKNPDKVVWAEKLRDQRPVDINDDTGVAAVIRHGKAEIYPVLTDEMLEASATSEEELAVVRSLELTSIIFVPMIVQGESIGAITFASTKESNRNYTDADLRLAQELANRASLAIANARSYQTAQDEIAAREELQQQLIQVNSELEQRVKDRTTQLEESNVNLMRSNQELQDFAYVASHDLQEPLRKIQAFGNLLEDEFGDSLGEGKDYLERMRSAASRMSVLIEDLLSFSRVTTKAKPFEPVDLNVIAKGVVDDLEVRISDTNGKVIVDKLPVILADALQMRQLLQNLIGNALKFAQEGQAPIVHVSSSVDKAKNGKIKAYKLLVEDNGIGFDEKYLDRIFSVFQRLHGKDKYQGTGIGLAICRKIAERHGGTITAKSREGKGSTFIVTIPAKAKETDD